MPEIPRDPRQLARDILSGKIKLEDLQRERQRQAAVPPASAKQQVRQVPIGPGTGRPVSSQMPSMPGARPPQTLSSQRPTAFPPRQAPAPSARRQFPVPPPVRTVPPPKPARTETAPLAPVQKEYAQASDTPAKPAKAARKPARISEMVKSRQSLRQAVLLSEILGKPISLRD